MIITHGAQESERHVLEPLVERFNHETPGIRVQLVVLDDIVKRNFATISDATFDSDAFLREVVSAADTTTSNLYISSDAMRRGYVLNLKPLMDADATFDQADFYVNTLDEWTQDGAIYLLPSRLQIPLLAYNKDLWQQRGLPAPKPNWTLDDLLDAATHIATTRNGTVDTYGLVEWSSERAIHHTFAQAGVDLRTAAVDTLRLDQPALAPALAQAAELMRSGAVYFDPAPHFDVMNGLVTSGKAGLWDPNLIALAPGELPPVPAGFALDPPSPGAMPGKTRGYIISGGTRHPEAAWQWLSFLSRHDVRGLMYDGGNSSAYTIPARRSVAEHSGFWTRLDGEAKAALEAALRLRETAQVPSETENGRFYYQPLVEALRAVITDQQSPERALAAAQAAMEHRIAEAQHARTSAPLDTRPIVVAAPVSEDAADQAVPIAFGATRSSASRARLVAKQFNQQQSEVHVTVNEVPPSNGTLTLPTVADGNDCFAFPAPPTPDERASVLDLQPLLDADAAFPRDEYPAALLAPFRNGTQLSGLPDLVIIPTLGYNPTLFHVAGSSPPTATWTADTVLNAAQQLTSGPGDDQHYGYASLGNMPRELGLFLARAGATPLARDGGTVRAMLTDPNVVRVVTDYLILVREFSPHTRFLGYSREELANDALPLIADGKIGMWFNLENTGVEVPDDATTAPLPFGTGPLTTNDVATTGLYISATTQRAESCWMWLKALSGSTTGISTDAHGPARLPARRSIAVSESFTQQAPQGTREVATAYHAAMQRSGNTAVVEASALDMVNGYWFFRAVDRALQGSNLARELEDAQFITEQYLACAQGGETAGVCAQQVDPAYAGFVEP